MAKKRKGIQKQARAPTAESHLSPNEVKVLRFRGLFSHLPNAEAFTILDIPGFKIHDLTVRSLVSKGLLMPQGEVTGRGWDILLRTLTPDDAVLAVNSWKSKLRDARSERDQLASEMRPISEYVSKLNREPNEQPDRLEMPDDLKKSCEAYLGKARLCCIVGAWSGAVAYCTVAVEQVLAEIFARKGTRKPYEEMPPLQELLGEVSKTTPQISNLTKRLIQLIGNFRNDAVHPRDHTLRPGENQARTVYELTCRVLSEVRHDWFQDAKSAPAATPVSVSPPPPGQNATQVK